MALPREGFQSLVTLAACCVVSFGLHLLFAREYGDGSRFVRAGLPFAPAAAWQLPPPAEMEVSLPSLPAGGLSGGAGAPPASATPALSEPGTILVTDLAPLPSVPGLEAENEPALAPLPTLLPQTDSQSERERVLGFDPRGFAFGNPGLLLPAPVVPLSVALRPAAAAAQAPRMANAFPVSPALGGLPPPPNFGLDAPTPPPSPAGGTPQTTAPPDGDGPPTPQTGAHALPAPASTTAPMAFVPSAPVFPIMPVEPAAAPAAGMPPPAPSSPSQAAPVTPPASPVAPPTPAAPTSVPAAAPPEPGGDGKTPAAVEPKTPPAAKPEAAPAESGKAGESANKSDKADQKNDKPAPNTTAAAPPAAAARPDDKVKPAAVPTPAAAIPVPLTRADATNAADATGPVRYRGAFSAPREGNYRLRLTKSKGAAAAKVLVDGAPAKTTLRLKAGRHRVEVEVPNGDAALPVLEVTATGD